MNENRGKDDRSRTPWQDYGSPAQKTTKQNRGVHDTSAACTCSSGQRPCAHVRERAWALLEPLRERSASRDDTNSKPKITFCVVARSTPHNRCAKRRRNGDLWTNVRQADNVGQRKRTRASWTRRASSETTEPGLPASALRATNKESRTEPQRSDKREHSYVNSYILFDTNKGL